MAPENVLTSFDQPYRAAMGAAQGSHVGWAKRRVPECWRRES